MIDPTVFGCELIYTVIVVCLFAWVYFKTLPFYKLTKHQGIKYFRDAFCFFGLAYFARFIFHLYLLGVIALDIMVPVKQAMVFFSASTIYFSTMALLFLAYSAIYKELQFKKFILLANVASVVLAAMAILAQSPIIIAIVQLPIIVAIIILTYNKTKTRVLYLLLGLFWIINLVFIEPKQLLELKLVSYAISIILFAFIIRKVAKWTK